MTGVSGSVFATLGGDLVDPPTVMPAALPLELSGEAVRARLCIFSDNQNRDMAMRPDLTLPLALREVDARKAGLSGERTVRYAAKAFRLPTVPDDPVEFVQVGCERYGIGPSASVDAELYATVAQEALQVGVKAGVARFGDLAVFDAFVDGLGLPTVAGNALRRAFREDGGLAALLDRSRAQPSGVATRLKDVSPEHARHLVKEMLDMSGVALVGTRTLDEVVIRLTEQAAEEDVSAIPETARAVLRELVSLETHPGKAVERLSVIAEKARISGIEAVLTRLADRLAEIRALAPEYLDQSLFSVAFGRRFTYYDGFVFELADPNGDPGRPFGAGGRYDRLLFRLSGGKVDATAIGGVVRPDRLEAARKRII